MVSLFFLMLLFPVMLLAQEAAPVSKNGAPGETQIVSGSEAHSETNTPSVSVVSNETNTIVPAAASPSLEPTAPQTPADPSATPSSESAPSEEHSDTPAPVDPNASAASETEEPLKAPSEMPSESIEKKEQQIKVRYYEVRAQVEKDPEIAAMKKEAEHAPSDERKRQVLRAYYNLLFKKMKAIDVSIENRCDTMEAAYLRRLEQISLEPSIPLAPFSEDSKPVEKITPAATPSPTSVSPAKTFHKKKTSQS